MIIFGPPIKIFKNVFLKICEDSSKIKNLWGLKLKNIMGIKKKTSIAEIKTIIFLR